jgi:hypothetical protein
MWTRVRGGWPEAAALVWGLCLLSVAGHALCYPRAHTVYDIYADAARNWWAGEDIYARGREYYRYSPLLAITLTPFTMLPDHVGNALWKLFNAVIYMAGLFAWARVIVPQRLDNSQAAGLWLLALPLSLHSLYIGQANLLMVGAVLLGLRCVLREEWNRAAAWLAFATLVKGYPLGLAMILTALFPRRFSWRYLTALAAMLLAPFATQPIGLVSAQYASWAHHLRASTTIMRERLRSIDYLFQIAGRPLEPTTYAVLGATAACVVLGLCLVLAQQGAGRQELLTRTYQWFTLWVVLFGPATEASTYAVLAPSIAWELLETIHWRSRARCLLLCASLLLMGLLGSDLFPPVIRNFCNEHGGQPIGALLFLCCLRNPVRGVGRWHRATFLKSLSTPGQ